MLERTCQFDQRERVPARSRHEPLPYVGVHRPGAAHEQVCGLVRAERRQVEHGQVVQGDAVCVRAADREHHRHRVGSEPAGDEGQCRRRRTVEPVGIVEHAQHRPLLTDLAEEAKRGQRDQEPVVGAAPAQAERDAEGVGLGLGEAVGQLQHGAQQAVQGRVWEFRLRLDAATPEHGHPVGTGDQLVKQSSLADAGLTAEHQNAAGGAPGPVEQVEQSASLRLPPRQHSAECKPRPITSCPAQ